MSSLSTFNIIGSSACQNDSKGPAENNAEQIPSAKADFCGFQAVQPLSFSLWAAADNCRSCRATSERFSRPPHMRSAPPRFCTVSSRLRPQSGRQRDPPLA